MSYTSFYKRIDNSQSMINVPKNYYLAHPLASRHEVRKWELSFETRAGIQLLNPFYDVHRPDIEDLDSNIQNPRVKDYIRIVEDDLGLLRSQEGLLCFLDNNPTIGVYQEMVYGFLDKKIVHTIVREQLMTHTWINYHSKKMFRSLEEFEEFVVRNS